jgi:RimJ/RimL family protein N-acetyltransferase
MVKMNFVPMDEAGLQIWSSWFDDPAIRRWLSPPSRDWLSYVQNEPGVYAWMVHDNRIPVGHLQVDIHEDGVGYLGFAVNPELRRQGYGKRMLVEFLGRPEIAQVSMIIGEVESGNVASTGCLRSVGFTQDNSSTEEGFVRYVINLPMKTSGLPKP